MNKVNIFLKTFFSDQTTISSFLIYFSLLAKNKDWNFKSDEVKL